jgi:hypothetical protein
MAQVLSFSQFHKLNEEEDKSAKSPLLIAAERILEVFFSAYGTAVPTIGDYADALKDLRSIENEKNLTDKGKKMQEVITKVAGKISDPYKDISSDLIAIAKKIGASWKFFLEDEEAKKEVESVQDAIKSSIDSYIENLISASQEKKKLIQPEKANEDFNTVEIGGYLILERLVSEERETLMSALSTFKTDLETQIKAQRGSGETKEYRQKCIDALKAVNIFREDLSDKKFDPLKRREKKEKIDEIVSEIAKLKEEITTAQISTLKNIALKGRIKDSVEELLTLLKELQAKMEKIELEKVKAEEESKKEDEKDQEGGEEEKEEDVSIDSKNFKELSVGGENAQKKGSNRDAIKSWQILYNTINPQKKISEDGLFGRPDKKRGETEDAIVYTANLLGNLLNKPDLVSATKNGTVLTSDLQAMTKALIDKMPEFQKLFGAKAAK